ncbi:MAG TPA: helix-turn-helix domain-containing protein [Opitutus sp.]|nr:helix-turn-helix domain-containing protein [Opitutus sp.]
MSRDRPITPHVGANPLVCGAFSEGGGYTNWRPRGSGDWLLIYTVAGAGRIVAEGRMRLLGARHAVLYRPGTAQDYSTDPATGRWALRWAHFLPKPHWEPWLAWPEFARGTGVLELAEEPAGRFERALERMLTASRLGGVAGTDLALNALEEALIWAHRDAVGDHWLALDPRVRKGVDQLAADPARPFALAELARSCGLSPSRFSHLFKAQVRATPRQFSEKLRLELASQLLAQTSLTVREIAYKTGFADPLYFSRRFGRFFQRTPIEVRRRPAAARQQ